MKSFTNLVIKTSAIKSNLLKCKKYIHNTKICAVVKADGYGVGVKNVVKAIDDEVDFYAVACFVEATKLRKQTNKKILVLNKVPTDKIKSCVKQNISFSVTSILDIQNILKLNLCEKVNIHIAINTGMNRIGFGNKKNFEKAVKILHKNRKKINIEGIFTHIFNAVNQRDTNKQICIFKHYLEILQKYFDTTKILKHTTASFATVKYPQFHFDMIRLGIALFGGLEDSLDIKQKQVVELTTKIVDIHKIKMGDSVGYNKAYVAKKDMTIATIPVGYADGIFRNISKKGFVKIAGKLCKIVGNVCMDMMMVDVSNIEARVGEKVVIIDDKLTIDKIAKWCGTISYEILTNIKTKRFCLKVQ